MPETHQLASRRLILRLAMVSLLTASFASAAVAVTPRDELLRYVPQDIGFCVALQDLRGHAARLHESPFFEQLRASPAGAHLREARWWANLLGVEAKLRKQLGVDLTKLHDDILGDAVVFAYRGKKGEKEQGLILIRARSAGILAEFVEGLNKAQKEMGELKEVQAKEHKGTPYFRRVEARGANYYALRGPVLVCSSDESIVQEALEKGTAADAEPALAGRFREGDADKALLALYLNPRSLDADINSDAAAKEGARTFAACWKAIDSIVWAVHLERDLRVTLSLRGRPAAMPEPIRRFLAEVARASDLWRLFPENALFAMVLRIPAVEFFDAVAAFVPQKEREAMRDGLEATVGTLLEKDFFKDILPAVGPDTGMCILPPASAEKSWVPQALLVVRVTQGTPGGIDQSLLGLVSSGAVWALFAYNREHPDRPVALKTTMIDKQPVKYLTGDKAFPPGVQPALALREGYLVLASSLEAVRRFRPADRGTDPDTGILLWRISFTACRTYLTERRKDLCAAVAEKDEISTEEAGKRLDNLVAGLQFLDRAEVRLQTAANHALFMFRLQPAQPLKR
jgi:hypothetical protein